MQRHLTQALAATAVAATTLLTPAAANAAGRPPQPTNGVDYHNIIPANPHGGCDKQRYNAGWLLIGDFDVDRKAPQQMDTLTIIKTLRQAGWSWSLIPTATALLKGESDGCTHSEHLNRAPDGRILNRDFGCWQINTYWHPTKVNLYDCVASSRLALSIYHRSGWATWNAWAWVKKGYYSDGVAYWVNYARTHGVN